MVSKINKKRQQSAVSAYVEGQETEKESKTENTSSSPQNKNTQKKPTKQQEKSNSEKISNEFDIYEELTQKQKPKNVFSGFHLEPQVFEGLEELAKKYEAETGMKKGFKSDLVNNILKIFLERKGVIK